MSALLQKRRCPEKRRGRACEIADACRYQSRPENQRRSIAPRCRVSGAADAAPDGSHEASAAFVTRSLWADPPDHASAGNLNQRTITRGDEFGSRIRLTEVSHRAVVGNPGAAVGPESYVGRTIEPRDAAARKSLLEGRVVGEP